MEGVSGCVVCMVYVWAMCGLCVGYVWHVWGLCVGLMAASFACFLKHTMLCSYTKRNTFAAEIGSFMNCISAVSAYVVRQSWGQSQVSQLRHIKQQLLSQESPVLNFGWHIYFLVFVHLGRGWHDMWIKLRHLLARHLHLYLWIPCKSRSVLVRCGTVRVQ